jgi:hypothetical protein
MYQMKHLLFLRSALLSGEYPFILYSAYFESQSYSRAYHGSPGVVVRPLGNLLCPQPLYFFFISLTFSHQIRRNRTLVLGAKLLDLFPSSKLLRTLWPRRPWIWYVRLPKVTTEDESAQLLSTRYQNYSRSLITQVLQRLQRRIQHHHISINDHPQNFQSGPAQPRQRSLPISSPRPQEQRDPPPEDPSRLAGYSV